jgi:hypothetical protein
MFRLSYMSSYLHYIDVTKRHLCRPVPAVRLMWVDHSQLLSTDERLDVVVVVVVIIIIIVSCYAVLVRTLAAAHRRFRNLIKTLVRTPLYN